MIENKEAFELLNELKQVGFEGAIAFATDAEIQAGGACGQLSLITE